MTEIRLPGTIAKAQESLAGIEGLVTAKEWERAAIVYAFTRGEHRGTRKGKNLSSEVLPMTNKEFSHLGITGLRSENSVGRYRNSWQNAIDAGLAEPAEPGDLVVLPDAVWVELAEHDVKRYVDTDRMVERIKEPKHEDKRVQIAREALADPQVAEKVLANREVRHAAHTAVSKAHVESRQKNRPVADRMPEPKMPAEDQPEPTFTHLNVAEALQDLFTWSEDALELATKYRECLARAVPHFTEEQRQNVTEWAEGVASSWQMVSSGGVTDEALEAFLGRS